MASQVLWGLTLVLVAASAAAGHVPASQHDDHEEGLQCSNSLEAYNLGLAAASVFILLGVSLLGSVSPLILSRVKHRLVEVAIKVGGYCGSGVVLATAFVHVLLPANEYLTSPCLPEGWHSYEPMAFMICVATIVFFQVLEFFLEVLVERFQAQHAQKQLQQPHGGHQTHSNHSLNHSCDSHQHHDHSHHDCEAPPSQEHGGECKAHRDCQDLDCNGRVLLAAGPMDVSKVFSLGLAELAIAFHSVIIGVALGVTPAGQFKTLLVALAFHQFLEGFALGSAVADMRFSAVKSYLLALFYSLSTPLGIAIGIAVRTSFNSNAVATLVTQGVLDSICAGVLVYVVLCGPMNAVRSSRAWLRQQGWAVHILCFGAFAGGAAAMAVIGKWA